MINKKFIQQLKKYYDKSEAERRQIISLSNTVLHDAKRVIFALHRHDISRAGLLLEETEKTLVRLEKKFGLGRINREGAYRAGVEEYVEAKMFYLLLTGAKVDKIKRLNLEHESYLAGICDLTGELVRLAINQAAQGKPDEAENIKKIINDIMTELVQFDMTGYLRTKYDQAKNNLKKIEQINYDIRIRR